MVSIIVPVLNEERTLEQLGTNLRGLAGSPEIIFADGGSTDQSTQIALRFGRVIRCARGRARQMNAGARVAGGDVLLFLHADCMLGEHAATVVEQAVCRDRVVGGCLTQVFPTRAGNPVFAWISLSGTIRARLTRRFYGDQAIFCRREVFENLGGFSEIGLFEDVEFSRRLARTGLTTILSQAVYGSTRRWDRHGLLRTTLVNWTVLAGFLLRVRDRSLERAYRITDSR